MSDVHHRRTEILEAMGSLLTGTQDDDRTTFILPPGTQRILDPSTTLVIGARGSGKSALARYLVHRGEARIDGRPTLDHAFDLHGVPTKTLWFDAFSQHGTQHPDALVLDQCVAASSDDDIRTFWLAWLVLHLLDRLSRLLKLDPDPRIEAATQLLKPYREEPGRAFSIAGGDRSELVGIVDDLHAYLARNLGGPELEGFGLCAVYDDLDMVGAFDPTLRARFVRALLTLWTSFSTRYRYFRAKIFLPADLLDLRQFDTLDVSKLMARSERLEWDVPSLYRLVLRHLGQQGERMRAWLATFGLGFAHLNDGLGWMPEEITEAAIDRWLTTTLRAIVVANNTRAPVQRWIANRLRDGRDRVAPRSMLGFFRESARIASRRPPGPTWNRLLAVDDAVEAIGVVGAQRVDEIRAVYPWVDRLLALRGRVMPAHRAEIEAWVAVDPRDVPQPTAPRDGQRVTEELLRLGLLRELRGDERLDMPDLFVEHFGVLRQ